MPKKRKDGYLKSSFTYHKKRYYVYGRTKQELFEKEKQKREELETCFNLRDDPTLEVYYQRWLNRYKGTVSSATVAVNSNYFRTIKKVYMKDAKRSFGEMLIKDITIDDLFYVQTILHERGMTTATTNFCMNLLKRLLRSAEQERIIKYNPSVLLKSLKRTEERMRDTLHRALTKEEQKTLFDSLEMKTNWYYNVFRLAILTGMRIGEIAALRFSDIKDNKIYIQRTLTRDPSGKIIIGMDAKTTSGRRTIPLNDEIRKIIKEQRNILLETNDNILDINDTIFHKPNGNHINAGDPGVSLKKICDAVGIERISTHALRATFATRCIEAGMNVKTLQEILGHKDYGMTMNLYGHVIEDTKELEMKKVNINI